MYCSSKGCKTRLRLDDVTDLDTLSSDEVMLGYDWTPSPSWDTGIGWDGNIWCPEHAVEADDFWGEHADSEY